MTVVGVVAAGWVEACGLLLVIGCALAAVAVILGAGLPATSWHGLASRGLFDRERDMAANLGWRWRNWVAVRLALVGAGVGVGVATRIWVLVVIGSLLGSLGFRFALAGRAAGRRLRMERAFLARLRDLRDRIAIGNQSLDTALQEIGGNPGADLEYVLAPLGRGARQSTTSSRSGCVRGRRWLSRHVACSCGAGAGASMRSSRRSTASSCRWARRSSRYRRSPRSR